MSSYRQILKSSSILGGSQVLGVLLSLISVKINAVYLGPAGTGLINNYQNIIALVSSLVSLGIGTAAVRELTLAYNKGDQNKYYLKIKSLMLLMLILGLCGWVLLAVLSSYFSNWTFNNNQHQLNISILGFTLVINNLTLGIQAQLQSRRRIGRLACCSIITTTILIPIAWLLYSSFRIQAVITVIMITSLLNFIVSYILNRETKKTFPKLDFCSFKKICTNLIKLGLAFALAAVFQSAAMWLIGAYITSTDGEWYNGIYKTSLNLSSMFVGFVLNAMATDYYPRLTAVSEDSNIAYKTVVEQFKIGILMCLPGILAMQLFSPLIIRLFYTDEYFQSILPLRIFLLSCYLKVASWPFGFILLAKGKALTYSVTEIITLLILLSSSILSYNSFGVIGLGIAAVTTQSIYLILIIIISGRLLNRHFYSVLLKFLPVLSPLILFIYTPPINEKSFYFFGTTWLFITISCLYYVYKLCGYGFASRLKIKR